MKFGKTYMETLASPTFPQEWREGAIEYKHLKKLINGVVAELESLGLGADVLRELMVPTASGGASDSDDKEDGHTLEPSGSSSSNIPGGIVGPAADSPPAIEKLSILPEEAEEFSLEKRQGSAGADVSPPSSDGLRTPAGTSSAAEWLASFSQAQNRQRRSSGSSRTSSRNSSVDPLSQTLKQDRAGSPSSPSPASITRSISDTGSIPGPSEGARRTVSTDESGSDGFPSRLQQMSADGTGIGSGFRKGGMGRKELASIRRVSEADARWGVGSGSGSLGKETEPSAGRHDWGGHSWRSSAQPKWTPSAAQLEARKDQEGAQWYHHKEESSGAENSGTQSPKGRSGAGKRGRGRGSWVQGKNGRRARAEYELGGTPEHPVPRIRLFIESPDNSDSDRHGSDEDDDGHKSEAHISELGGSPLLPPVDASKSSSGTAETERASSEKLEEKDEEAQHAAQAQTRRMRTREIVFPLTADTEFLDTLTGALSNLSNLQHTQREQFLTNTESLCSAVARVASPYATKSDLYVWREIFSLWVEMQIFESERERDRGELSVDESERRLKHFADELAKRGWGADAPPSGSGGGGGRMARRKVSTGGSGMKDQASLEALDDFLRLNVALLDVKKFQRVNVEAARKILKKHDKRTALTASSDLRAFMAEQEAARARAGAAGGNWIAPIELPSASDMYLLGGRRPSALTTSSSVGSVGGSNLGSIAHPSLAALLPSSTTGMLSESLPHILLSLLTTTLLPILPSIDDYSCAICTSVAWRPIRLDCRHLFCIRCLVKLQKKGRSDCPLCRMPGVVSSADQRNMDDATLNMLKTWFPTEVKEKDRENEAERQKEEMEELGIGEDGKCVVC